MQDDCWESAGSTIEKILRVIHFTSHRSFRGRGLVGLCCGGERFKYLRRRRLHPSFVLLHRLSIYLHTQIMSGKKFFRPPPTLDDSDDDDDEDDTNNNDEESDEELPTNNSNTNNNQANANLSSSDDDDDEEDDDDEDDDDAPSKKRKAKSPTSATAAKQQRRAVPAAASSFLDDQAASDDEDSEEDIGDGEHMDQTMLDMIRQQDRERGRRGGGLGVLDDTSDIHQTAQAIERRHQRTTAQQQQQQQRNTATTAGSASGSTGMIPSNTDPSLWMISCSTGKETDLVYQLMNKCMRAASQRRPIHGITSIVAAQTKGKLYIESYSEPAVNQLLQGVRQIMPSTKRKVPIHDMVAVMTVKPTKQPVRVGDWVRMTRGHYKGDLALVRATKESGLKCIVQCVPRLDLTLSDLPPEQARIRRKTVRPAQKFLNPQELASLGKMTHRQRHNDLGMQCDSFEGQLYHDGYVLKEMTVGHMVQPLTESDPPTLDELARFQHRSTDNNNNNSAYENEGSKSAASLMDQVSAMQQQQNTTSSNPSGGLAVGDTIEVTEGDLVGLRGKITSVTAEQVSVMPDKLQEPVDFLPSQVRKYIPVGCHVKVMDGHYANETGTVVAVKDDDDDSRIAIVLTDVTNHEISVRTSQLRESADIASGGDRLAGYELYDLVLLTGGGSATNEVGVIVRVGREDFTIVINQSTVRENVRPEALRGKRNTASNRAVTMDAKAEQIRSGDTVGVTEGVHKGKTATVKRMHRSVLFLHSQTRTQHAGIFVVRAKSCVLTGSRAVAGGGAGDDPFRTPASATPGSARGGGPGGGRRGADDGLMGKTVRIQAGQWKGHLGIVSDTTATHVQVELHARLKKVMVVRDRVVAVGDKFGSTGSNSAVPESVFPTAASAMATPMVVMGGATPAIHGFAGATPSHDPDESDEVWRPQGSSDIKEDTNNDDNDNIWGGGDDSSPKEDAANDDWATAAQSNASDWGSGRDTTAASSVKQEEAVEEEVGPEELPPWFVERVHVEVKATGKEAIIQEITDATSARVQVVEDGSSTSVRVSGLTMQAPKEHDVVLVTGGTEVGLEGNLVCVDGSDAILKNANDEFKIIEFVHLAKIGDGGKE